jgi:hypothetical protein
MLFGKNGRYLGGILLFVGLLLFVAVFAGFSSGFFSHSFAQSAIKEIVNYTVSQDQLNSVIISTNTTGLINTVTPQLNSEISNVNCGMGCIASSYIDSLTGVKIPMDNIDLFHYELLFLAIAIAGAVLMFFSYKQEKKLTAIGKNVISSSIISIVLFYLPLAFILPLLLSFTVSSYSVRVPTEVFSGFTASIFTIDVIVVIVGLALIIAGAIIKRIKSNPVQSTGTKLIITKK